jgi:hypothetical protein
MKRLFKEPTLNWQSFAYSLMKTAGSSNFFENQQAPEVKTENYMVFIRDPEFVSEETLRVSHQVRQHSRDTG